MFIQLQYKGRNDGNYIGGYAAEYTRTYPAEYNLQYGYPNEAYITDEAKKQLLKSLNGELNRRGLKIYTKKKMEFNITLIKVEKKYGVALAALCFISFQYAEPVEIK